MITEIEPVPLLIAAIVALAGAVTALWMHLTKKDKKIFTMAESHNQQVIDIVEKVTQVITKVDASMNKNTEAIERTSTANVKAAEALTESVNDLRVDLLKSFGK
jgi:esterase/lipase